MSTTSSPVDSNPVANASFSAPDEVRLSMPSATACPPRRFTRVPYARPTSSNTGGVMSIPTLPRTS